MPVHQKNPAGNLPLLPILRHLQMCQYCLGWSLVPLENSMLNSNEKTQQLMYHNNLCAHWNNKRNTPFQTTDNDMGLTPCWCGDWFFSHLFQCRFSRSYWSYCYSHNVYTAPMWKKSLIMISATKNFVSLFQNPLLIQWLLIVIQHNL